MRLINKNCSNNIERDDGYTLIEILVSINVSFILISVVVSVYLFTSRLTSLSMNQIDSKTRTTAFLAALQTNLEEAGNYTLQSDGGGYLLVIGDRDTTYFTGNKITNKDLVVMDTVASYELLLSNENKSNVSVVDGTSTSSLLNSNGFVTSAEMNRVQLTIEQKGKKYYMSFVGSQYLTSNFNNIEE